MVKTLISLVLIVLLARWKWDELRTLVFRYVDLDWDYEIWSPRSGTADNEVPHYMSEQPSGGETIVYITPAGTRYHRAECGRAGKDALAIPLREAKMKYKPCGQCKPDA